MSCKEQALNTVKINSLSTRQAAKWFLLHERRRHLQDIAEIDVDLEKLKTVELPSTLEDLAGNVRFEL